MINNTKQLLGRYINYRIALYGAIIYGGAVLAINLSHGLSIAIVAAAKQATYSFFVAGFITNLNDVLSLKWDSKKTSMLVAVSTCSALAISLTYLVHCIKGTAEPLLSTLPTILMAPPGFIILAWQKQRASSEHIGSAT